MSRVYHNVSCVLPRFVDFMHLLFGALFGSLNPFERNSKSSQIQSIKHLIIVYQFVTQEKNLSPSASSGTLKITE
ncbi:hypothetical protein ACTXT7_012915 [Hymenolepis weldensis]